MCIWGILGLREHMTLLDTAIAIDVVIATIPLQRYDFDMSSENWYHTRDGMLAEIDMAFAVSVAKAERLGANLGSWIITGSAERLQA